MEEMSAIYIFYPICPLPYPPFNLIRKRKKRADIGKKLSSVIYFKSDHTVAIFVLCNLCNKVFNLRRPDISWSILCFTYHQGFVQLLRKLCTYRRRSLSSFVHLRTQMRTRTHTAELSIEALRVNMRARTGTVHQPKRNRFFATEERTCVPER